MARTLNSVPYMLPSELSTYINEQLNPSVINLVYDSESKTLTLNTVIDSFTFDYDYEKIKKATITQRFTKSGIIQFERKYEGVTFKNKKYTSTQDNIYDTYIFTCEKVSTNKIANLGGKV